MGDTFNKTRSGILYAVLGLLIGIIGGYVLIQNRVRHEQGEALVRRISELESELNHLRKREPQPVDDVPSDASATQASVQRRDPPANPAARSEADGSLSEQPESATMEEAFRQALVAYENHATDARRAALEQALSSAETAYLADPSAAHSRVILALKATVALRDTSAAWTWLERVLTVDALPEPLEKHLAIAAVELARGHVEPVRLAAAVEDLITRFGADPATRLFKIQVLMEASRIDEAYEEVDALAKDAHADPSGALGAMLAVGRHDPRYGAARRVAAMLLGDTGRAGEAVRIWRDVIQRDPWDAMAHDRCGVLLLDLGEDEQALTQFQEALAVAPERRSARFHLAVALANLERCDDAVREFREVTEQESPLRADARFGLAVCLARQGRYQDAESELRRALALKPELLDVAPHVPAFIRMLEDEP